MSLQDLIEKTELEMSPDQIKAFFLGTLCAESPLPFPKAMEELTSQTPEAAAILEKECNTLFYQLGKALKKNLREMFPEPENGDTREFLTTAKDQLEYFLMGMSLAGTSIDNCDDEDLSSRLEELEDLLEDMEDYIADESADEDEGDGIRDFLKENWGDYVEARR